MSTKSARIHYRRGGLRADTKGLDRAQRATQADLDALSAKLDSVFGSTRGSLLTRGASAWQLLTPGTSGHFLKSNGTGADLAYAAAVHEFEHVTGSPFTISADLTVTGLSAYKEIIVELVSVTSTVAGFRYLRVSVDNGANYLSSSGDYVSVNSAGVQTNGTAVLLTGASVSTARGALERIYPFSLAAVGKRCVVESGGGVAHRIPTTSALNAIQIYNGDAAAASDGSLNGGTISVLGKRG